MIVKVTKDDGELLLEFPLNDSGINDAGQPYDFKFYPNENLKLKIDKISDEDE